MNVFEVLLLAHPCQLLRIRDEDLLCASSLVLLLELLLVSPSFPLGLLCIGISLLRGFNDANESGALLAAFVFHIKRQLETGGATLRRGSPRLRLLPRAMAFGTRDGGDLTPCGVRRRALRRGGGRGVKIHGGVTRGV